ncbi:MAG: NAD(P)H-hydrate dehydratase [Phycisphaera sp.]|nr:MAG: NAD(P)H-hydrate dehydratase [Phycisphaera sp.]
MSESLPAPRLPARKDTGHKGVFGRVAVVGGCALAESRMIGAPALTARAAGRAGAGLVRLLCPEGVLNEALTLADHCTGKALPTNTDGSIIASDAVAVLDEELEDAGVVVIGPGLGRGPGPAALALRAVQQQLTPVVVDADALNELSETTQLALDFHAPAVVTPHPGEFARLAKALGMKTDATDDAKRPRAAEQLAQRLGCVVVLKGARTVVSDGIQTWGDGTADSALATGGTGDVLAGLIGGFIAQHARPVTHELARSKLGDRARLMPEDGHLTLFEISRCAVVAHAHAARLWREKHHADAGLTPGELADELPEAVTALRG